MYVESETVESKLWRINSGLLKGSKLSKNTNINTHNVKYLHIILKIYIIWWILQEYILKTFINVIKIKKLFDSNKLKI